MSINKWFGLGNLTRDVEVRYIPSGSAVGTFTIAINRKYTINNEKKEEVAYVKVVAWGKLGELCNEYLAKGSQCFVEGRIQSRSWEKDGVKQYATEVVAENVQFLSRKKEEKKEEAEAVEFGGDIKPIGDDDNPELPF